jgi:hypothetical protein
MDPQANDALAKPSKAKKMKTYQPVPDEVHLMFDELSKCLEEWEIVMPKPSHSDLVDEWKTDFKRYVQTVYPADLDKQDEPQSDLVHDITAGLLEAYSTWQQPAYTEPVDSGIVHALLSKPQTEQRSENWYAEFLTRVTASEIYKIFGSPRERATLALQKAGKIELSGRGSTNVSRLGSMSPFDWGICLEPVVKLVLESEWDALIHECGRFVHPTDPRFAASPDGLLLRAKKFRERGGHLLEIKCPKSRKIGVKLPIEYFYQMQLQMEVTGVRACEYVEMKFDLCCLADYKAVEETKWKGLVAVVGCFNEVKEEWLPCKYVYGPLGDLNWRPDLELNQQTLELNVWTSPDYFHTTVYRDAAWFETLKPKLEEFWLDVERAKRGEFVLPESSRKKADTKCLIVDSEPDELPKAAKVVQITKLE